MKEYLERFSNNFENIWKLFNHTNDGLIITNVKQEILAANPTYQKITGYTYEELYLKTPSMLRSGETPQLAYTEMWTAIIEKGTWTGELLNKSKNGETYWTHITITEIKKEAVDDRYYIGVIRDITASKLVSEEIAYYAFNDHLTDMPNRVRFNQVLTEQLKEHEKNNQRLAILFFDLDRFKIINDTFGHPFGDDILKSIATRLKEAIGDRGVLGRFGGDEFTILLPNINSEKEVTDLISTIFKKFSELPIMSNERSLFVTTSVGVSFFPEHGQDVDTLIKKADTAMYCSKDRGRNNYQIYDETINQDSYQQPINESDLRKALANNQFKVYYQVQVDLKTGATLGFEALIRWDHPQLGLIAPSEFLRIAEDSGLIVEIDDWVLGTACQQVKKWNDEGHSFELSVNISRKQFERKDFVDVVKKTVRETGLKFHHLKLEITENIAIINVEVDVAIQKLQILHNLGVKFTIDDFGTDYSSLRQLKRFPIDTLKIDKLFLNNSNGNVIDTDIIKLIIAMAKILNCNVLCEGIETEEQLALLIKEGCQYGQGFLFSKPIEAIEVEASYLRVLTDTTNFASSCEQK